MFFDSSSIAFCHFVFDRIYGQQSKQEEDQGMSRMRKMCRDIRVLQVRFLNPNLMKFDTILLF